MRRSLLFAFGWFILLTTEGLARGQSAAGSDPHGVWATLLVNVMDLREGGHYEAAYDLALKALDQAAERFGAEDFRVGVTLNQVGLLCNLLGRDSASEAAYLRAIRIIEQDPSQRLVLSEVLHNLSTLYLGRGARFSQADRLMRRSLEIGLAVLGPAHPDVGAMLANLASVCVMRRHDSEARVLFERAVVILEENSISHQPNLASVVSNLGYLTARQGDHSRALVYILRGVALYEQSLGVDHPELVIPLLNLGQIYLRLHHAVTAEVILRRAAAIAENALGPEHPTTGEVFSTYAVALRKNGKRKDGRPMEARAKAIRTANAMRPENATVHVRDLLRYK